MIRKFYVDKYSLFSSSGQIICGKPVGSASPIGFVPSTESTMLLRADLCCRLNQQCFSAPICVVDSVDSASPAGFVPSTESAAVIGADWRWRLNMHLNGKVQTVLQRMERHSPLRQKSVPPVNHSHTAHLRIPRLLRALQ